MPAFPIVGNKFRKIDEQVAFRNLAQGQDLLLKRDPDNEFDPNAVEVHDLAGHHLGFIPKNMNEELAGRLDNNEPYETCFYEDGKVFVEFSDEA